MKIIRSWPEQVPADRPHVVDALPKFVMGDYCYRGLVDLEDDLILLEWDIAVDREGLEAFMDGARSNPDDVLVAPYRIYSPTEGNEDLPQGPIWVMRRYNEGEQSMRWVTEDDEACHLFGLGMTYLPRELIRAFVEDWPGHFNDTAFSGWHYRNVQQEAPIAWDVRPAHLHYPIERMV